VSAYTITILVKQLGELLPEIAETRNTQHHIERLVGGTIKPIAFNHPIYGVVQCDGEAVSNSLISSHIEP